MNGAGGSETTLNYSRQERGIEFGNGSWRRWEGIT